jgi:hypothetical protein
MSTKVRPLLLVFLCTAFLVGCGSGKKNTTLTGKVLYNGNPVTGGQMAFYPAEGGGIPVTIASDGTYTAVGLPPGEVTVTVETESINPNRKVPTYGGPGRQGGVVSPMPQGANTGSSGTYVKIPEKYAKKETTDLKFSVEAGDQTKDIELKD